ncbi:MAG: hypothetical protein FWE84_01010 [Firmicutes bacterium]|nr:hypothetical protein [Bacillota bacterium]
MKRVTKLAAIVFFAIFFTLPFTACNFHLCDFGEWTPTMLPTCTQAGLQTRACSQYDYSHVQTKPIPALGHDLTDWEITHNQETGENVYAKVCKREGCGYFETYTVPALPHEDIQISFGWNGGLMIEKDGSLWAWGRPQFEISGGSGPIKIKEDTKFAAASAGASHNLAIDIDGNLWAWGSNYSGVLGDGTNTDRSTPVQIKAGTKFSAVSAGCYHSLAIDIDGNLWAWGLVVGYLPGVGEATSSNVPIQIKEGTKFVSISASMCESHSFAIDVDGNLWAWGDNNYGQLGTGSSGFVDVPIIIKEGTRFAAVNAGRTHTLAIDVDGNLWAWGYGFHGELGDGRTGNESVSKVPVQIKEGTKFAAVAAGENHSLAIDTEGNLWGWGNNYEGSLATVQAVTAVNILPPCR